MKKHLFSALTACILLISCQNDDTPDQPTPPAETYMNMNAGSRWNYELINNSTPPTTTTYTVTSTNRDTTITGKTYHIYTNSSTSASEYYRISGGDHYTYESLPAELGGAKVENLYLKAGAAVNTTWSQLETVNFQSIPLAVTVTHKIEAKGLAKTVNGISYTNVIHVSTSISVAGVPPTSLVTDIDSYYAPNHGLIENTSKINLNYLTIVNSSDFATRLKTSTLL